MAISFTDYAKKHDDETLYDILCKVFPKDSVCKTDNADIVGLYFQKNGIPDFVIMGTENVRPVFTYMIEVEQFQEGGPYNIQGIYNILSKLSEVE